MGKIDKIFILAFMCIMFCLFSFLEVRSYIEQQEIRALILNHLVQDNDELDSK